jgi:hypothetical protein
MKTPWGAGCWWADEIEWPWQGLTKKQVEDAIWAGDMDWLDEHLHCECCCNEHTGEGCPARLWGGCRGQGSMTRADEESWARHYGMTLDQFFGGSTLFCVAETKTPATS